MTDNYPAANASWPSMSELGRIVREEQGLSDHICKLPPEPGWWQCKCGAWGHVTTLDGMTIQQGESFTIKGPTIDLG